MIDIDYSKLWKQIFLGQKKALTNDSLFFFSRFKNWKKNHNKYVSSKIRYSTFKFWHKGKSPNEINLPFQYTNAMDMLKRSMRSIRWEDRSGKYPFYFAPFTKYEKLQGFIFFQSNPEMIIIIFSWF